MANIGVLELLIFLLLVGVAIPWIVLPFALFGIKPLLREILAEMRETKKV